MMLVQRLKRRAEGIRIRRQEGGWYLAGEETAYMVESAARRIDELERDAKLKDLALKAAKDRIDELTEPPALHPRYAAAAEMKRVERLEDLADLAATNGAGMTDRIERLEERVNHLSKVARTGSW